MSKPKKQIDPLTLITEKEWTKQVIDLAHVYNWKIVHFRAARTKHSWVTPIQGDGKGFFDTILVRGDRLIFAELKTEKGELSQEQWDWHSRLCPLAFANQNIAVCIWRPSDFDEVQGILK